MLRKTPICLPLLLFDFPPGKSLLHKFPVLRLYRFERSLQQFEWDSMEGDSAATESFKPPAEA